MHTLTINPKFQGLIPPLTNDEYCQLEENIQAQGCRDAIKVWKGVIIDGHNRYAICQAHNVPFDIHEMRFTSKKDAEMWIIENQLGRRNLTDAMRIDLAARMVGMMQSQCGQIRKRQTIAKKSGKSEQTVRKYLKIKESNDAELLHKVNSGEIKIGTAYNTLMPAQGKALEAIERIVVTMYDVEHSNEDFTADNELVLAAVLENIDWLEKFYRFMLGKVEHILGDEEIDRIQRRLRRQMQF